MQYLVNWPIYITLKNDNAAKRRNQGIARGLYNILILLLFLVWTSYLNINIEIDTLVYYTSPSDVCTVLQSIKITSEILTFHSSETRPVRPAAALDWVIGFVFLFTIGG
ncbi:hypothetical protein L9F63_012390, partial [Diploptera punctata]